MGPWMFMVLACREEPSTSSSTPPADTGGTSSGYPTALEGVPSWDIEQDADLVWQPATGSGIDGIGLEGDLGMYPAGDATGDGLADVWVAAWKLEHDFFGYPFQDVTGWALLPGGGGGLVPDDAPIIEGSSAAWVVGVDIDGDGLSETVGGTEDEYFMWEYAIWQTPTPVGTPDIRISTSAVLSGTTYASLLRSATLPVRGIPGLPGGIVIAPTPRSSSLPTAVYLLEGPLSGDISPDTDAAAVVRGQPDDRLGRRIDVDDLDGDGINDLLTSRDAAYPDGEALLYTGPLDGELGLSDAALTLRGWNWLSPEAYGDFDGDGEMEILLLGSSDDAGIYDVPEGYVWAVPGRTIGDTDPDIVSTGRWYVDPRWGSGYGAAGVFAVGDLDESGTTDVAIGAPSASGSYDRAGAVLIQLDAPVGQVEMYASAAVAIQGSATWEFVGGAVWGDGDYDGDGLTDLVIGSDHHDGGRGLLAIFSGERFR